MSSEMKWKLVPVEPTEEMIVRGARLPGQHGWAITDAIYRVMLAAAPEPPAPAGEVVADTVWLKRWTHETNEVLPKGSSRDDLLRIIRFVERHTSPPTVSPDAVRRAALAEWRGARQAVFDLAAQGKVSPEQWDRLSRAEHALMDIARALATQPAPDGRG